MPLERIRLATKEEVEAIEKEANLTPMCRILKMGEITGVWRVANELDPVLPNGAPPSRLYKFLWGVENLMKGSGVTEYFYNVPADDTHYHKVLEDLGAERLSKQPEYRFRVNL